MSTATTTIRKDDLLLRIREGGKLSTAEQLRLTVTLAVPAILAELSSILMFYIDDAMVGSLGARASASVGLMATSLWLFWSVISCAATGFSVQVAHLIGANDLGRAKDVFRQSILASLALAVATMAVSAAIAGALPRWLGGSEDIAADASVYFLIFVLGAPLAMIGMLAGAMLRSAGNMKVPSLAGVATCVMDVSFNFLLIFPTREVMLGNWAVTIPGCGLGVPGAAVGTVCAEGVVGLFMLWYAVCRQEELRLTGEGRSGKTNGTRPKNGLLGNWLSAFVPEKQVLRRASDIASPILLQRVLMNAAQIVTTMIVAPLGAVAIAANALGITAESLCYMPGYGLGGAATTLVGQSYGAGRRRLTERFAWLTTLIGIAVMSFMGVVMYIAAPLMMATLTPDEAVRQLGVECLRIEAWAEPMFAASIVAMSCFVGAGDTRKPALMNLFSMWAVRITLAALLAPRYGLHGVWIGMAVELTFRGMIFLIRLKWGRWMKDKK